MSDSIYRHDAIKAIETSRFLIDAIEKVMMLPSTEPKTGKWIYDGDCYICNKCGTAYSWWADSQTSNYCPNCGCRMLKEGEEHD